MHQALDNTKLQCGFEITCFIHVEVHPFLNKSQFFFKLDICNLWYFSIQNKE